MKKETIKKAIQKIIEEYEKALDNECETDRPKSYEEGYTNGLFKSLWILEQTLKIDILTVGNELKSKTKMSVKK